MTEVRKLPPEYWPTDEKRVFTRRNVWHWWIPGVRYAIRAGRSGSLMILADGIEAGLKGERWATICTVCGSYVTARLQRDARVLLHEFTCQCPDHFNQRPREDNDYGNAIPD